MAHNEDRTIAMNIPGIKGKNEKYNSFVLSKVNSAFKSLVCNRSGMGF